MPCQNVWTSYELSALFCFQTRSMPSPAPTATRPADQDDHKTLTLLISHVSLHLTMLSVTSVRTISICWYVSYTALYCTCETILAKQHLTQLLLLNRSNKEKQKTNTEPLMTEKLQLQLYKALISSPLLPITACSKWSHHIGLAQTLAQWHTLQKLGPEIGAGPEDSQWR